MLLETAYLGPARVAETAGSEVHLILPDQEVDATLAVSYQPAAGDVVLTIGQDDRYYVIGVILGAGKTVFSAFGDLEFRAPRGKIDFIAGSRVRLQGPEVEIKAGKLHLLARSVVEKFSEALRWIQGAFHIHAGQMRHVIEGSCDLQAKRITERADQEVRIDGSKIHLG